MLEAMKYMKEQDPTVDTNALFRYLFATELKLTDRDRIVGYSLLNKILFPHLRPVVIHNRAKTGRMPGECYANSFIEWKNTKNKPILVYECFTNHRLFSITPHACNITPSGEVYDTDNFQYGKKGSSRIGWVLREPEEMIPWLTAYSKDTRNCVIPTIEFGDWMCFTKEESAWAIHCKKDLPGSDECKTTFLSMNHFDTDDLFFLVEGELERLEEYRKGGFDGV